MSSARHTYRVGLFKRRGCDDESAQKLADALAQRDLERDDRRMCIECRNWQHSKTCAVKELFLPRILQRCPRFAWQTPA